MSLNFNKVKKFFSKPFRGDQKSEVESRKNVRWKAVPGEDKLEDNEWENQWKSIDTFPVKLNGGSDYVTRISLTGSNVQVTRASVYVNGDDKPSSSTRNGRSCEKRTEVNGTGRGGESENRKSFEMDAAAITFFDSDNSIIDISSDSSGRIDSTEAIFDSSEDAMPSRQNRVGKNGSIKLYRGGSDSNVEIESATEIPVLPIFESDAEIGGNLPDEKKSIWIGDGEEKFESNNSLDVEKELNDLIGRLSEDIGEKKELEKCKNAGEEEEEGSRVNLAFDDDSESKNEPEENSLRTNLHFEIPSAADADRLYWTNQRSKSRSFTDKCRILELEKLIRRGKERMSMIELRGKRKGISAGKESSDSGIYYSLESDRFEESPKSAKSKRFRSIGDAHDRSSLIESKISSDVHLARRPRSEVEIKNRYSRDLSKSAIVQGDSKMDSASCSSSPVQGSAAMSPRVFPEASKNLNDCIDWSWLEEAMNSLNSEPYEINTSLRVDAGCQTQPEQTWQGEEEEERLRRRAPSPRVSVLSPCSVTLSAADADDGESRFLKNRISNEDMPHCKPFAEGSGTGSGVSSWLRQSMRRVRHFNLEDPTQIRSAPPDSLRIRIESEESDTATVNRNAINSGNEVQQHQQQQQIPRPVRDDEVRSQRRRRPGSRPSSAPPRSTSASRRRSDSETVNPQQQMQPETETPNSPPPGETQDNLGYESDSTDRHPWPRGRRQRNFDGEANESEGRSPLGPWPHGLSSVFAGLGCTLGLFNISRFAVLSIHFGSNFIIQFILLSLVLGVPLLAFHAALGQTLGAGPVDMWKISPLFQGIGVALLLAQALIGMYSIVGVSWMFVYFRDSFITKQDSFRWAESFRHYKQDIFATSILNTSGRLEETVPDYLNVVVLQRHGLTSPENAFGQLKFQLTFNLAVVWMIVFVSLSKGLRSYGKVVYVFSVVPVLGALIICSKLLGLTSLQRSLFPQTEWSEFFLNANSWLSAGTEVMLTWNLLGVATMQVTSHNRSNKRLWRDIATITLLTLFVLLLAAFIGNLCHQLISIRGYSYVSSSFEKMSSYSFLRPPSGTPLPSYAHIPIRYMPHASLVAGERVRKPTAFHESGYQVLRLATELVPAALAILEGNYLSPFWAVLFYFTFILFGIAQQLVIWHCVITGIMAINAPLLKSWETTITFFTCAAGFVLGLPMTTELGIFVVYFLDYCLGGGWWVILLTLMEICAILMVRGRPYSGENISIALFGKRTSCFSLWAIPLLTFIWNVVMPVALLIMSIAIFKSGGYRDLWVWKCGKEDYWPLWTRQVGVFVQIVPLLCIPVVGLLQCYRYLSKGPADIFDRLANLYRPAANICGITDEDATTAAANMTSQDSGTEGGTELPPAEDPPPKYTPPPSYSTATGTRIAKLFRQSFRRSVRRIQTALGSELSELPSRPPPPDYASVLVEMNHNRNAGRGRENNSSASGVSGFTASDVAQILRCSFRRTNGSNLSRPIQNVTMNNLSQNLVAPSP